MWVIVSNREEGQSFHTVGYYNPKGEWVPNRDFPLIDEAARYVHWLNGGDGHAFYEEAKR